MSEHRRIILELCDSLRDAMLAKLDRIPETWTGRQLRQWFADLASDYGGRHLDRQEMKGYRNDRLDRNL